MTPVATASPFAPVPVTLSGQFVRLEPLALSHVDGLISAGRFDTIWHSSSRPPLDSRDAMQAFVSDVLAECATGAQVPFVTVHQPSGQVIGATRFVDIAREHRRLEIGYTWITPEFQRTPVNSEAKYLQLRHVFDDLGGLRVQFKTDLRNTQSQRALEGIGAEREGVFRRHMILSNGYVRDSVYYGITDEDWPRVRRLLETRLLSRGER